MFWGGAGEGIMMGVCCPRVWVDDPGWFVCGCAFCLEVVVLAFLEGAELVYFVVCSSGVVAFREGVAC